MKLLLYCTKAKPYLQVNHCVCPNEFDRYILDKKQWYSPFGEPLEKLNGKIVAECDFEVEELTYYGDEFDGDIYANKTKLDIEEVLEKACLDKSKYLEYVDYGFNGYGYAIHIKNLHIFDEPKELSDYCRFDENGALIPITKAPQNMMYAVEHLGEPMYVENHYIGLDDYFKDYIVISVRPEWMCLICNRIKDVEVRRKVLKEMLK